MARLLRVTDRFGAQPFWRTPPLPAPSGGVIDAGSVWVPEGWGWGASQIYARILEAYDFCQAQTGRRAPGYGGRVRVIDPWNSLGYDDAPKAQGKPDGLHGASAPVPCK